MGDHLPASILTCYDTVGWVQEGQASGREQLEEENQRAAG